MLETPVIPTVTTLYAGILGLMAMGLAFAAGAARGKTGILMGDGGNMDMIVAMRRQANFLEFVPLILILLGLLEMSGVSSTTIHVMGSALVVVRGCHAVGMNAESAGPPRVVGAAGSTLILLVASVWAITTFF